MPNDDDPFKQARAALITDLEKRLQQAIDVSSELDKTLVSISAGALVFSMTFTGILAPHRLLLPVLFVAWTLFALCITSVVISMNQAKEMTRNVVVHLSKLVQHLDATEPLTRRLDISPKPTHNLVHSTSVGRWNTCALIAFGCGILTLGVFVGYNLWHG